jgi:hypothetical protein
MCAVVQYAKPPLLSSIFYGLPRTHGGLESDYATRHVLFHLLACAVCKSNCSQTSCASGKNDPVCCRHISVGSPSIWMPRLIFLRRCSNIFATKPNSKSLSMRSKWWRHKLCLQSSLALSSYKMTDLSKTLIEM